MREGGKAGWKGWACTVLALAGMALPAPGDEFGLTSGAVVTGTIQRITGPHVVLRTRTGVRTYHVMEFSESVRSNRFEQAEADYLRAEKERRDSLAQVRQAALDREKPVVWDMDDDVNAWLMGALKVLACAVLIAIFLWIIFKPDRPKPGSDPREWWFRHWR